MCGAQLYSETPSRRSRRSRAATRSEAYACTCAHTYLPPRHLLISALTPKTITCLSALAFLPFRCSPCSLPTPSLDLDRFCSKFFPCPTIAQQVEQSPKSVLKLTVSSPSMGAELSYPQLTFICFDANTEVSYPTLWCAPASRHPSTPVLPLVTGRLHVPLFSRRARATRAKPASLIVLALRECVCCFDSTLRPPAFSLMIQSAPGCSSVSGAAHLIRTYMWQSWHPNRCCPSPRRLSTHTTRIYTLIAAAGIAQAEAHVG